MITKLNASKLVKINELIERANKLARKHNLSEMISMKIIGSERVSHRLGNGVIVQVPMITAEITGTQPTIDGWEFVGLIDHEENGNILRGMNEFPVEYRTASQKCDVCGKNIERKQTFIIVKNGEYKQVGSGCLKDFFAKDIMALAELFNDWLGIEELAESDEFGEDEDYIGGAAYAGNSGELTLVDFIAYIQRLINEHGWLSKSKAEIDGGQATISRFWGGQAFEAGELTNAERETASKLIEEAKSFEINESEYEWNISRILASEFINEKLMGIAASIVTWAGRKIEKRNSDAMKAQTQNWFGTVGEKITITVKVASIKKLDSYYGISYLCKFYDQAGNLFVWFTSNDLFVEGETVTLKGTIKEHSEFNGDRQTVITRCKVQK